MCNTVGSPNLWVPHLWIQPIWMENMFFKSCIADDVHCVFRPTVAASVLNM